MKDFFSFKRMLTPVFVYMIFMVAVLGCFVVGFYDIFMGNLKLGILLLILAPVAVRIVCEFFVLFFRMNETLTEINNKIKED